MASARAKFAFSVALLMALATSCKWGESNGADGAPDAGVGQKCGTADSPATCSSTTLCVANECRQFCTTDLECTSGRCLYVAVQAPNSSQGTSEGVCVDDVPCSNCTGGSTSDCFCPQGSSCASDGQCRNTCAAVVNPSGDAAPNTMATAAGCANGESCVAATCPVGTTTQGACGAGFCFATTSFDGGPIDGGDSGVGTTFASNDQNLGPLAYDGTYVYWTEGQTLRTCPRHGCTTPSSTALAAPIATLVAAGGAAYWIEGKSIKTCQASNCEPTTFWTQGNVISALAIAPDNQNDSTLAWAEGNGALNTCATGATCAAVTNVGSVSTGTVFHVATDGAHFYWTDSGNALHSCPMTGCTDGGNGSAITSQSISAQTLLTASNANVYFTDGNGQLFRCSASGCANGMAESVISGATIASLVAYSTDEVFWSTPAGVYHLQNAQVTAIEATSGSSGVAAQVGNREVFWTETAPSNAVKFTTLVP